MQWNIRHETHGNSHQLTIQGLLQLTTREDGSVIIDLKGRHIEVIREMSDLRLTIREGERYAFMAPEIKDEMATLIEGAES